MSVGRERKASLITHVIGLAFLHALKSTRNQNKEFTNVKLLVIIILLKLILIKHVLIKYSKYDLIIRGGREISCLSGERTS